jgi:hypothetical protein
MTPTPTPLPAAEPSPRSTIDRLSLAADGVHSLQRKMKSKQSGRSSTILANLFDPLALGSPGKPKVTKERTSPPLAAPYRRERRVSFLEDVRVEQELGWGASVVGMFDAKLVGRFSFFAGSTVLPVYLSIGSYLLGD